MQAPQEFATHAPFQRPTAIPINSAISTDTIGEKVPAVSIMATTVAQSPKSDPTDRSISPCAITISIPSATTAVIEDWRNRLMTFRSLRKIPSVITKNMAHTIAIASRSPPSERE